MTTSTIRILNFVRTIAVVLAGVGVLFGVLLIVYGVSTDDLTGGTLPGVLVLFASVVQGALAFAVIGWFADSLSLLKQIAASTQRSEA